MSHREKRKNFMESQNKPFEDGLKMAKSNSCEQMEDIIDILSTAKKVPMKKSFIAESHPINKKAISKDKSNMCKKNIPNILSFPKSEVDSTLKEKNFAHFFKKSSMEMFQKLWFPPATDSLVSDSFSLNGCLTNSGVNYSVYLETNMNPPNKNYLKTCYQLLHTLPQNITEKEDIQSQNNTAKGIKKKNNIIITRCRKIRVYPNKDYINFFNKCFGATRFIYNRTISSFQNAIKKDQIKFRKLAKKRGCVKMIYSKKSSNKSSGSKTTSKKSVSISKTTQCCQKLSNNYFCNKHKQCKLKYNVNTSFIYWRNKIILSNKKVPNNEKWLTEIPYDTRQLVIKNVMGGIKAALSNLKKGHIKTFHMKYKTKTR